MNLRNDEITKSIKIIIDESHKQVYIVNKLETFHHFFFLFFWLCLFNTAVIRVKLIHLTHYLKEPTSRQRDVHYIQIQIYIQNDVVSTTNKVKQKHWNTKVMQVLNDIIRSSTWTDLSLSDEAEKNWKDADSMTDCVLNLNAEDVGSWDVKWEKNHLSFPSLGCNL